MTRRTNPKRVIMTETELRELLGVSGVALWKWRQRGCPVVAEGRPGIENTYDAGAVLDWCVRTGCGGARSLPDHVLTGIEALKQAVGRATGTPAPRKVPRSSFQDPLQRLLFESLANALIPWAAAIVYKHALAADRALDMFADLILFVMAAAEESLGASDVEWPFDGELEHVLSPEGKAELIERIRALAATFEDEPGAPDKWPAVTH